MPSANKMYFTSLEMLHKSFTYNIKSLGPNIEPCGKPHDIFNKYEWKQSDRQNVIYLINNFLSNYILYN